MRIIGLISEGKCVSVARYFLASYRKIIRLILVPVIIIVLLLNAEKRFLRVTPEKIRASIFVRNSVLKKNSSHYQIRPTSLDVLPHQRTNQKIVTSHKPPSNGLQKRTHSKVSLPKNKDTKSKDHDQKNTLKHQANETSSLIKWLKLLKNPNITSNEHLLVMVTTWVSSEEKRLVHDNVARLWSYWPKLLQPIAYLLPAKINTIDKKKHLIDDIKTLIKYGWIVRSVPKVSCGDVPVLKFMILDAMKLFPKSNFYGFANSDILFDSGLIETLKGTKHLVPAQFPLLILGQRTNLNVMRGVRFTNPDSVLQAAKNGSLMKGIAIDYFITNTLFPWNKVPDLVVGRITYDNWMVYFGISQNAIVIDASKTLTALHQTTADGDAAGWRHAHRYCNKNLIESLGKRFRTRWGYTWCVPHKALKNPNTSAIELKTINVSPSCNPRKPPFVFLQDGSLGKRRKTVKSHKG